MKPAYLFAVVSLAILALIMMPADSDSSDAATAYDVRVFVETEDEQYAEYSGEGTTVEDVIEGACAANGIVIEYTEQGTISSVGGISAPDGEYWNIHQWMPLGTHDWASVGYDSKSDSRLLTGTSYCIHHSDVQIVSGKNVYTVPSFQPESDGYVFIRFDYKYDDPSELIQVAFTTEDRMAGFWLKGRGTNMGEVLTDAMEQNEFELDAWTGESGGNDLQYWINSMYGIGDEKIGDSGWAYWSQYAYLNDLWSYNGYTIGYYDPGVYKYIAMVYIASVEWEEGGEETDVVQSLPKITSEEDIDSEVRQSLVDVSFVVEGVVVKTIQARVGHPIPSEDFPEDPVKEGVAFAGWGYDGSAVTGPMVLTATFSDGSFTVEYYDADGNKLYTERVSPGESAKYSVIPVKDSSNECTYTFKGWSADGKTVCDLSKVMADLYLIPLFDETPREYTVTYKLDGAAYGEVSYAAYGTTVEVAESVVKTGYTISDWATKDAEVADGKFTMPAKNVTFTATSSANKHLVTYMLDGEVYGTPASTAYGASVTVAAKAVKTGYTVTEWSTGDVEISDGKFTMPDSAVTFTATSTVNKYTVTYMLDGEVYGSPADAAYGTTMTVAEKVVKTGYTVSEWLTGDAEVTDGTFTMPAKNVTFTAASSVNKYAVTYMLDGEVYIAFADIAYGTTVTVADKGTKTGYTVTEWATDDAEVADGKFTMPDNPVTFTATSSINSYNISYIFDGESYESFTAEFGTEQTVLDKPLKNGYIVHSWTTSDVSVSGGKFTVPANDVTFTCTSELLPDTKVVDNGDGTTTATTTTTEKGPDGEEITSVSVVIADYGGTVLSSEKTVTTISGGTEVNEVCRFKLGDDGSADMNYTKQTSNGESAAEIIGAALHLPAGALDSFNDLALSSDAVDKSSLPETVRARMGTGPVFELTLMSGEESVTSFKKTVTFEISYSLSEGESADDLTVIYIDGDGGMTPVACTYDEEEEAVSFSTDHLSAYGIVHDSYTITFDSNGGSAVDPVTLAYGAEVTAPADPVLTGYTFAGWDPELPDTMPAEDLEVTAVWTANGYTIAFSPCSDEAEGSTDPVAAEYDKEAQLTPNGFTWTGRTFAGWATEQGGGKVYDDGDTVINLSSEAGATVALYALWTIDTYTVTFELDGATYATLTGVEHGTVLAEEDIPVPEVPEGKYFSGWSDVTSPITADTVITGSILDKALHTVTYLDAYGDLFGSEEVYDGEGAVFSSVPDKASTAEKDFTFDCWLIQGTSTVPDLSCVTSDLVLEPSFTDSPRQYKVTFVLDGETVSEKMYDYGTVLGESDIPVPEVPEGMVFSGWGDTSAPITSNRTFQGSLYAAPECTVRYYNDGGQLISQEIVQYGAAAKNVPTAVKTPDQQYVYTFAGWSSDGVNPADLTSITEDLSLYPLFTKTLQVYSVFFYAYDASLIKECKAEYGSPPEDMPDGPAREDTIDKVYTFAGWYIRPFVDTKPNSDLVADLDSIVSSKMVYAAYTYIAHPYTLTIICEDETITRDIAYGKFLSEDLMMGTSEGSVLKFYRDADMSEPVNTSYMFTNDTTLYAEKVAGTYSYTDDTRRCVRVDLTEDDMSRVGRVGDAVQVADISQFSDGKSVELTYDTVSALHKEFGDGTEISIAVPRGSLLVEIGGIMDALDSDESVVFAIGPGPTTSVRLNTALKNVCTDATYTITMKISGYTIVDTQAAGISVSVILPYVPDPVAGSMVWAANANTGVLTSLEHSLSDGTVVFKAGDLLYFAVGTTAPRSGETEEVDWCPYGEVDYSTDGESSETYNSTLNRMDIDNRGMILFVPSSLEGYPLWHIGPDAFSGVKNAPSLVIPATIKTFDWSSLYGSSVYDVYFMGDKPEFTGEAPSSLTVHYSDKASGWSDTDFQPLVIMQYSKITTVLQYCLIGDEVVIVKWVKGTAVDIPAEINVGGTDYPVTTIGCEAFAGSEVVNIRIPATVQAVQTKAFYKCTALMELSWAPGSCVKVLADECFRACYELRSSTTTIPDTVCFIGFEAFRDCQMFRSIIIPNSVTDIRAGAFYDCILLYGVTIGSGVTVIPERCFGYCNDLDGVLIPDGVTHVGNMAFYKCTMLTDMNLNRVEAVGTQALSNCQSLVSITLGASLASLGKNCFSESPMLSEVKAYCVQPDGIEDAGIPSDTAILVNYDVAKEWTYRHEVIEKEDDLKQSFEARTMPYVVGGMIVVLVVLGVLSIRARSKYN